MTRWALRWTEVMGETLLHSLWQGLVIAMLLLAALWLMRHASSAARYAAACLALAALPACLLVTAAWLFSQPAPALTASAVAAPAGDSEPTATSLIPDRPVWADEASEWVPSSPGLPVAADMAPDLAPSPPGGLGITAPAANPGRTPLIRTPQALAWLVTAWGLGALGMILRLAARWWAVRRVCCRRHTRPLRGKLLSAAQQAAKRAGVTGRIRFLYSDYIACPCVVGVIRPMILLPVGLATGLTPAQLEALLLHELAHIRRHDYLINLLQALVESLLFYHPAVWWISRQVRAEREYCCDRAVVTDHGVADATLCQALLYVAEQCRPQPPRSLSSPSLAAAADGGELYQRIRRLLEPRTMKRPAPCNFVSLLAHTGVVGVAAAAILTGPMTSRAQDAALPPPADAPQDAVPESIDGRWVPFIEEGEEGNDGPAWFLDIDIDEETIVRKPFGVWGYSKTSVHTINVSYTIDDDTAGGLEIILQLDEPVDLRLIEPGDVRYWEAEEIDYSIENGVLTLDSSLYGESRYQRDTDGIADVDMVGIWYFQNNQPGGRVTILGPSGEGFELDGTPIPNDPSQKDRDGVYDEYGRIVDLVTGEIIDGGTVKWIEFLEDGTWRSASTDGSHYLDSGTYTMNDDGTFAISSGTTDAYHDEEGRPRRWDFHPGSFRDQVHLSRTADNNMTQFMILRRFHGTWDQRQEAVGQ